MSTTSAKFGCQEFSQNAWKKDLCSNCFKPRADHEERLPPTLKLPPDVRPPPCPCKPLKISPHLSSAINNNNNNIINNNNNNNVVKNWNSKKIGSNGVQLWEVGGPPLIEVQIQNGKKQEETSSEQKSCTSGHHVAAGNDVGNGVVKKVQSILRDTSVGQNGSAAAANNGQRRGSTVEFLEGSPKVIGYGGRDYDWNSSRDNSEDEDEDDASDLDSLDSFNLSEEEKAFTQLTDQNTEFNADNSNLLTAETFKVTPVLIKSSPDNDQLVTKPSISDLYSKPVKSMTKHPHKMNSRTASADEDSGSSSASPPPPPPPPPLSPPPTSVYAASSSANAQEFIRSNLYSTSPASTSDTDDFLDAEEFSSAEASATAATSSSSEDHVDGQNKKDDGQKKPHRSEASKLSTVKIGFQSVPVRCTGSTQQRASVQQLFNEEPVTAAERRAAFKQSLPIPSSKGSNGMQNGTSASDDVKNKLIVNCSPYGVVAVTSTTTQESCKSDVAPPQIPSCPPPDSDDESQRLPVRSAAQRSNGANRSCHYASSYVTSSESIKSQPPPLPSPYSSTTLLKGIPTQKPPPPAIKPKPKLPAKPSAIRSQVPASQKSNRTSVLYQEIDENPLPVSFEASTPTKMMNNNGGGGGSSSTDQASTTEIDSSFESPRQGGSSDGNSSRRVPKRRAPKPPKESIDDNLDSASRKLSTCSLSSLKDAPTTSPSAPKTSTPTKFLSSRSYTLNSSSRTSSSSLESYCSRNPSIVDDDHQQQQNSSLSPQPSVYKDAKLKKNRFSLKKLLKFGTSKDGGSGHSEDASKSTNGDNRRVERLHILHPIDLMQNKSTNGDHSDVPSDCSPTRPISDHRVQNKAPEVAVSATESPSKEKPPPPRRFRSQQEVVEDPIKEKPVRPPPPTATAKQIYRKNNMKLTRSHTSGGRELPEDEKRNSIYDCGMEYANLGDIRNSVAPKKPGRCASSMTDITVDEDIVGVETRRNQLSASHVSLQNYGAYGGGGHQPDAESGNYYSPANDQESWPTEDEDEDTDDLYADQAVALNDSEEHSQSSSFTSEVMSAIANRSSDNSDSTVNGHSRHQQAAVDQPCKVYEVVVVKGRTLEKVYAKLPVVSSDQADCFRPTPTSSPTGPIADHVQSQTTDDDGQRNGTTSDGPWPLRKKFSRLSLRKAKSIVHKNLEDNYGAVVSANHQTLTQILDQVSQCQHANTSKLKVLEDTPLRWSDFALLEDSRVTMVGRMAFYSAVWQQSLEVTLMVSPEPLNVTIHSGRNNPCVLMPCAEFEDHIPKEYVLSGGGCRDAEEEERTCRATVWVMERMRVETLTGVAEYLHLMSESDVESYERESCFVLLQLINGLKHLQVQGTEEVTNGTMDEFLLVMKTKDTNYRFLILPEGTTTRNSTDGSDPASRLSLCRCALKAMLTFLCAAAHSCSTKTKPEVRLERLEFISSKPAFRLIGDILMQERATSLSQAKLLLEYMIWGPSDQLGANHDQQNDEDGGDQEKAYQRWLDLERATVLNNLIRTQSLWQIRLTVFEEYMLSFLVRTCAKTLREAAAQLQMAATSHQQ